MTTHTARVFQSSSAVQAAERPLVPNGVLVQLADESDNSEVEVRTARGNFAFRLSDLPFGTRRPYLQGQAQVERVADWSRVTTSSDEQDYPATDR